MKTKLLKKIRRRFKVVHNQEPTDGVFANYQGKCADVYDKKAFEVEQIPYVDQIAYKFDYCDMSNITLAEELTVRLNVSISLVKKHREKIMERKRKSFVSKNF